MNTYTVTVESYDGHCKRVKVQANDMYEAMAKAQKGKWYPVEAVAVNAQIEKPLSL